MIFDLKLPLHQKARIWVGESPPPPCQFDAEVVLEELVHSDGSLSEARSLTLEMLIPTGARMLYGLLGADSIPTAANKARVLVNASDVNGGVFKDSLASKLDDVRVGLPLDYAESVMAGVSKTRQEATIFPAAEIQFKRAAHGRAGSDPVIFRRLSRLLTRLMILEKLPVTEAEMRLHLQVKL
jgi:hypothetical protein